MSFMTSADYNRLPLAPSKIDFEKFPNEMPFSAYPAHRHFDLVDGENIVWTVTERSTLRASKRTLNKTALCPVSWHYAASGDWSAYEFLDTDSESVIEARIGSLWPELLLFAENLSEGKVASYSSVAKRAGGFSILDPAWKAYCGQTRKTLELVVSQEEGLVERLDNHNCPTKMRVALQSQQSDLPVGFHIGGQQRVILIETTDSFGSEIFCVRHDFAVGLAKEDRLGRLHIISGDRICSGD